MSKIIPPHERPIRFTANNEGVGWWKLWTPPTREQLLKIKSIPYDLIPTKKEIDTGFSGVDDVQRRITNNIAVSKPFGRIYPYYLDYKIDPRAKGSSFPTEMTKLSVEHQKSNMY